MTVEEKQEWLEVKYPLTIISDRYDGTYSGASWLAFPLYCDEVPSAVDGYDEACAAFWKDYSEPVGKGNSAQTALDNLIKQMHEFKPEESEDERIRKAIVCGMNVLKEQKKETFAAVPINDCLAWLEKQKEQKPSINIDQLKSLMLQYLQEAANEKDDSDIEADTDKWARKILGYIFEQKPSWSEEDEKMLKNVLFVLESYVSQSECASSPSLITTYPTYYKEIDWLKSLRQQSHWKPSEEQISAVKHAYNSFPDYCPAKLGLKSLYEDLKKL